MGTNQSSLQNDVKLFSSESNTKNCEISSDAEVKALESLPEEILIEILNFLGIEDLLNATLVSKKFNAIIRDSSKLLKRVILKHPLMNNENWCGTRNYPNVIIYCTENIKLSSMIFNEASVKVMTLDIDAVDLDDDDLDDDDDVNLSKDSDLRNFLSKFENLQEFSLKFSTCKFKNCEISPLPKRKLRKLNISSNNLETDNYMNLFTNWQVKELILNVHTNFFQSQSSIEFLKNQNNLKHFETYEVDFQHLIDVKFKLSSLKIHFHYENDYEYLENFLQLHQDSLVELEICSITYEIAEILNKFTKLKKLTVSQGPILENIKSSTIENLSLLSCNSDYSFPLIKELYLQNSNLTTISDMKNLHKLTITETELDEISIPTVKILTLFYVRIKNKPFVFETTNLDELEIIALDFDNKWLIEYLDRSETKLKKLKIKNCEFSEEFKREIQKNCSKIKILEITNCNDS